MSYPVVEFVSLDLYMVYASMRIVILCVPTVQLLDGKVKLIGIRLATWEPIFINPVLSV